MSWVKIKYEKKKRVILSIHETREEAINDWSYGDNIIYVDDIEKYKQETIDWNVSMDKIDSGIKFETKKEIKQKENWDYNLISDDGKMAIKNAVKNSIDNHWMIVMKFYIEEKWADENFCCQVQIPQFKEKIYDMLSKYKK